MQGIVLRMGHQHHSFGGNDKPGIEYCTSNQNNFSGKTTGEQRDASNTEPRNTVNMCTTSVFRVREPAFSRRPLNAPRVARVVVPTRLVDRGLRRPDGRKLQ